MPGHPLLTPEENEILVPASAFHKLRKLGLLQRNRRKKLPQISPRIYTFLDVQFDALTDGLRALLGEDISGPAYVICGCNKCHEKTKTGHTSESHKGRTNGR